MKTTTSLIFALLVGFYAAAQNSPEAGKQTNLNFKENKGQVSDQFSKPRPDILFSGATGNMIFHLKNNGISYQLSRVDSWEKRKKIFDKDPFSTREDLISTQSTIYRMDINWLNANNQAQIIKGETLPGYENYYFASCFEGALHVNSYTELIYKNIYPGIDLKWYGKNGNLKYDYYLAAHSNYKAIQLEYKGAEKIYIDGNGELIIKTPLGIIKEQKPLVTQNNKSLEANWVVKNNIISFDIKNNDTSLPLIIDPLVRLWGTYYGGTSADDAWYTSVDASGNVYISGSTKSAANIATSGAHQTVYGGVSNLTDGYLVKFNSSGVRQWATYYGGTADDFCSESITDASGNVFFTGGSRSSNPGVISTPGSHQPSYSPGSGNLGDAFLVMLNSSGVRQWGTYYGGDGTDLGGGLSLDNSGNIYMVGTTSSTNTIATPGSQQPALANGSDAFLIKFNSLGVRQWGTYYGGNGTNDNGWDCVTNSSGETYISGVATSSTGMSTPGSHQPVFGGGTSDGFFAKFDANGILQWGTYYGGTGIESAINISLDPSGNLYGTGVTNTNSVTIMATMGSYQSVSGGANDAYLVKFDPAGVRLWATYFGGTGNESGYTANADIMGNVYLSGQTSTSSGTKIAMPCAYQSVIGGGGMDAFLAKFTGSGLRIWSTYYGGSFQDFSTDCRADALGNIYMCGNTYGTANNVLGSSNSYQPTYGGGTNDAFLVKFDGCDLGQPPNTTPPSNLKVCAGNSATLTTTCGNWYNSPTSNTALGTGAVFMSVPLFSDFTFYVEDFSCGSTTGTRTAISVTVVPAPNLTLTNSNPAACLGEYTNLMVSGASTYSWAAPVNSATSSLQVQLAIGSPNLYTNYTVTGTDASGCRATATIQVNPNLCVGIQENGTIIHGISVYPNPNTGAFNIQSGSDLNLILTSELGQKIRTIDLTSTNNFTVTLSDLPNGVYFLSGEKQNQIRNQKIIVLK